MNPIVSWIIAGYLVIGAVAAAFTFYAISEGIKLRDKDAELDRTMTDAENAISSLPGGVPSLLLVAVLLWPVMVKSLLKGERRS